eukprot:84046-Rhodomonas_salina.1
MDTDIDMDTDPVGPRPSPRVRGADALGPQNCMGTCTPVYSVLTSSMHTGVLSACTALTHLDLGYNMIGDRGA